MSGKIEYKPREEIDALLTDVNRMVVMSCGWCSAIGGTAGGHVIKELKSYIKDKDIKANYITVLAPCFNNILHQRLKQYKRRIKKADAIGIVSCAMGVKNLIFTTDGTKKVVPLADTVGSGARFTDWKPVGGPETCIPCDACVLGITNGVCSYGNCPSRLRTPCADWHELGETCTVDPNKLCPFYQIKIEGNKDALIKFEERLKLRNEHGMTGAGLFANPPGNMPVGRLKWTGRALGYMFARMSAPFRWMMDRYGY